MLARSVMLRQVPLGADGRMSTFSRGRDDVIVWAGLPLSLPRPIVARVDGEGFAAVVAVSGRKRRIGFRGKGSNPGARGAVLIFSFRLPAEKPL